MQPGTPRFSGGETTSRPNIDTFGRYLIIFGRFFRGISLRADSDPGGANFYIFVPSLGLSKTTARIGSSSSIAEKKLSDVHGVRSLIVYSIWIEEGGDQIMQILYNVVCCFATRVSVFKAYISWAWLATVG